MGELAGEWVILKDKKIIEHGKDAKKILEIAESKYKGKDVIISKIPYGEHFFY